MSRRRGSAYNQLASAAAENVARPEIPRKLGFALEDFGGDVETDDDAELDTDNASGPDLSSIDPSSLTSDGKAIFAQLKAINQRLDDGRDQDPKAKRLRSSHHAAGLMDNETVQKAQLFDALMENPQLIENDPRFAGLRGKKEPTVEMDPKVKEMLDGLNPEVRAGMMELARQAVLQDPGLQQKLQRLDHLEQHQNLSERQKNQSELNKAIERIRELGYDPEEIIDRDAANQIVAMRKSPAFSGMSMIDIVQRATGVNLNPKKRTSRDEIPPMQRGGSSRSNGKSRKTKRTGNIQEAGARALARLQRNR